jgi:hypothetical protein
VTTYPYLCLAWTPARACLVHLSISAGHQIYRGATVHAMPTVRRLRCASTLLIMVQPTDYSFLDPTTPEDEQSCSFWGFNRSWTRVSPSIHLSYYSRMFFRPSGFTTWSDIGPTRGPFRGNYCMSLNFFFSSCFSLICRSEAQVHRGEEAETDPDRFQDPDNEYGLFASTTYEQDGAYEKLDNALNSRRRPQRCVFKVKLTFSFQPLSFQRCTRTS